MYCNNNINELSIWLKLCLFYTQPIRRKVVTYRTSKYRGVVDVYKLAPTPVGLLCLMPMSFET